jgi:hypothetical protein
MEFKCNHCNNIYKSYQSRWNHVKRVHNVEDKSTDKSDDKPVISLDKQIKKNYNCSYCKQSYKHYQSRWKHEQKCKSKETINQQIINNNTTNNNNIQNAAINNGNINNDNRKQVIINNFGENNLECITEQFKKKLLKEFLFEEDYVNPIPLVIEKINFNPKYKENKADLIRKNKFFLTSPDNAKISNLKSKVGYKYTEGKWKAVEKDKLLNELVKAGGRVIDDYIEELEHIPENVQDGYDDFMGKKELLIKEIKTKIELACCLYFKNLEDDEDNNVIEV